MKAPPGPRPGTKEAGDLAREALAGYLLRDLPLRKRSKALAELAKADPSPATAARLAVLRYINELAGIVTAAQERQEGSLEELPQILIAADAPAPKAGSLGALKLLSTAMGSQYDETFPSSTPEPKTEPAPPRPFKSAFGVE